MRQQHFRALRWVTSARRLYSLYDSAISRGEPWPAFDVVPTWCPFFSNADLASFIVQKQLCYVALTTAKPPSR